MANLPDVRGRILEASLALLDQEGLAALSMREVARRAGVSHQAPYHYFADKESILAALVTDGFRELTARLQRALDQVPRGDIREALQRTGAAYVGFALDQPGIFRIMFRPELVDLSRFPEAQEQGRLAYAQLERLVATMGLPGDPEAQASFQWSVVHGLAWLLLDGGLGQNLGTRAAKDAHLEAVLKVSADLAKK